MSTLPKSRIRIAGDLFRFNRLTDLLRPGEVNEFDEVVHMPPRFHAADSLQVEVAIFNNGTLLTNLSGISRLRLAIKPLGENGADAATDIINPDELRGPASNIAPIAAATLESTHFNSGLTLQQWTTLDADKAHAIITLSSAQAALEPGERWLSLIAEGSDGEARTIAAGAIRILGGGPTLNALPQPIVEDLRDQAAESALAAAASADTAAISANAAHNAELSASTHADASQNFAHDAQTHATQAAQSALLADNRAQQADTAQQAASDSATSAAQSASNALSHSSEAIAASDAAQNAQTAAEAAADIAMQSNNAQAAESAALALGYRNQAQVAADSAGLESTVAQTAAMQAASYAAALSPYALSPLPAVDFDGISGQATSAINLQLAGAVHTLAFTLKDFIISPIATMLSKGGFYRGWSFHRLPQQTYQMRFRSASDTSIVVTAEWADPAPPPSQGQFRHFAITMDLTGSNVVCELYINGVSLGVSDISPISAYGDSTQALAIGAREGGTTQWTPCSIANFNIYNRALGAAEIAELSASSGASVPRSAQAALLMHAPMDEGAGFFCADRSGNGNHFLLSGTGSRHRINKRNFNFSWTRLSSGFLGNADRPVLPENAVIENIIWEDTKATRTTASLGYNAANAGTHVASWLPASSRAHAALTASSASVADRRLYLAMGANAGAVTVHVSGYTL